MARHAAMQAIAEESEGRQRSGGAGGVSSDQQGEGRGSVGTWMVEPQEIGRMLQRRQEK